MHILLILWTLSYIDMIDIWTLHYGDLADWILSYIQLSGIGLRLVQNWLIFEYCLYRLDWYLITVLYGLDGYLDTVLFPALKIHMVSEIGYVPFEVGRWERGPAVVGPREKASLPNQWHKLALSTGPTRVGFFLILCLKTEKSILLLWSYFCPETVHIIQNVSLLK